MVGWDLIPRTIPWETTALRGVSMAHKVRHLSLVVKKLTVIMPLLACLYFPCAPALFTFVAVCCTTIAIRGFWNI